MKNILKPIVCFVLIPINRSPLNPLSEWISSTRAFHCLWMFTVKLHPLRFGHWMLYVLSVNVWCLYSYNRGLGKRSCCNMCSHSLLSSVSSATFWFPFLQPSVHRDKKLQNIEFQECKTATVGLSADEEIWSKMLNNEMWCLKVCVPLRMYTFLHKNHQTISRWKVFTSWEEWHINFISTKHAGDVLSNILRNTGNTARCAAHHPFRLERNSLQKIELNSGLYLLRKMTYHTCGTYHMCGGITQWTKVDFWGDYVDTRQARSLREMFCEQIRAFIHFTLFFEEASMGMFCCLNCAALL